MPATTVTASVSRTALGLGVLNINDHIAYVLAAPFFEGTTVTWRRQQAKSPFVESQFTVNRVRDIVQSTLAVDVLAPDQVTLNTRIAALIAAFTQDTFNLTLTLDTQTYQWSCECADYSMDWTRERLNALLGQVKFNILRSPVPISGAF